MAPAPDPQTPEPCEVMPFCPICGGNMELVYDRPQQKVCVCVDCMSGLSVPHAAWHIARRKREASAQK